VGIRMTVSSQQQAPTALPPGKRSGAPCTVDCENTVTANSTSTFLLYNRSPILLSVYKNSNTDR